MSDTYVEACGAIFSVEIIRWDGTRENYLVNAASMELAIGVVRRFFEAGRAVYDVQSVACLVGQALREVSP